MGPHAFALARATGGELVFLYCRPESVPMETASQFLEELVQRATEAEVPARALVREGPLAKVVRRTAEEVSADLVILGRRGKSHHVEEIEAELRALSGPMHSPCPLMIVPTFAIARTHAPCPGSRTDEEHYPTPWAAGDREVPIP